MPPARNRATADQLLYLCASVLRTHKSREMPFCSFYTAPESSLDRGTVCPDRHLSLIHILIVQAALNGFGVDTMAAWAAFGKIDSLFWMINSAFGIAATTFVGQNFGAGKMDRVRKGTRECLGMALVTAILLSVILMSAGRFLFGIFTTDANVVEIGLSMMQIISPTYFLFVFIEVYSGALQMCIRDSSGRRFWWMVWANFS